MSIKEVAPKRVQEFRTNVRQVFRRGVNTTADVIFDEIIVWIIDDVFGGRLKTRKEAAQAVGEAFADVFPEKRREKLCRR
jgi:hypothetical protein